MLHKKAYNFFLAVKEHGHWIPCDTIPNHRLLHRMEVADKNNDSVVFIAALCNRVPDILRLRGFVRLLSGSVGESRGLFIVARAVKCDKIDMAAG